MSQRPAVCAPTRYISLCKAQDWVLTQQRGVVTRQ